MKITEGYMPFLNNRTYYRIAGEGSLPPLVTLHGGPGSTHNYFELLDQLGEQGRMIISYDQIGCGNSYLEGHPEFWNEQVWQDELSALIDYLHLKSFHLLGQSWGGMLAMGWRLRYPEAPVKSLILSSTLSASSLWASEQHRMIRMLPQEEQDAIKKAEETGDYTAAAYLAANEHYMFLHSSSTDDTSPECLTRKKKFGLEAYLTAWGPNEYTPTGTLKDFDITDQLANIRTPSLVVSGTDDLCTPLIAKTLYDRIPDSRWELFAGCRHMVFADQTKEYLKLLSRWMKEHD